MEGTIPNQNQGSQNRIGASTASENAAPKYKDVELRVKQADNGVIVEAVYEPYYYKEEWVFQSMEAAFAEIPSIMSVVQTKGKEKEMERERKRNSGKIQDENVD